MESFLIFILSFSSFLIIYFTLTEKLVKFENFKMGAFIAVVLILIFGIGYYLLNDQRNLLVLGSLPVFFITNLIFFRYLFFNSFTKRLGVNPLISPYNPAVIFPGALYLRWNKESKPSVYEFIFSVLILAMPIFEYYLILKMML